MSSFEEIWQTTRPTIRERTKFMFNNDLFSDVKFVVPKSHGDKSEGKQVISAHKFVLSISSPVFEAMFYGELAEKRDSIELPDSEYECLLEFFRYMYSDEVNLTGENAMGVTYLAKKYMVPSLTEKCTRYLQAHLGPLNVFRILPSAQIFEEKTLVDQCWEVIDEQTEAAVKSEGFATIDRSLLETLVERDTLNISEVELFKGVVKWARNETGKQKSIAEDGQEIRKIIGETIVKAIRFPLMKQEEFDTVVLDSKILTDDEITDIIQTFNSFGCSPVGFPAKKRSGPGGGLMRCGRFDSVRFGWENLTAEQYISFSVNHDILLHGVNVFGSKGSTYSVNLKLDYFASFSCWTVTSTEGTFSSTLNSSGNFESFDVLFKEPVPLRKGIIYCLTARIAGPNSWYGIQGQPTYTCSGIKFTLLNISSSTQSPGLLTSGQLNEIIFSLHN